MDIATLVYNRASDLVALLSCIEAQTLKPNQVIVIDNGSDDAIAIDNAIYSFPIKLIRIEHNQGIAAYNTAFECSKAAHVIVIDSDVLVPPTLVEHMSKIFLVNPKLQIAGTRVVDAATGVAMHDNPIHSEQDLPGGGRAMVQFNGCCFAVNRELFLKLGGFDRRLFIYVNEWDFCLRAYNAIGPKQIRYFPNITVRHKTSPSSDRATRYLALVRRNELWIRIKYYPWLPALDYLVRFIYGSLRRIVWGTSMRGGRALFLSTLLEGLWGLLWALKERKPLNSSNFNYLMGMRAHCKPPENIVSNDLVTSFQVL